MVIKKKALRIMMVLMVLALALSLLGGCKRANKTEEPATAEEAEKPATAEEQADEQNAEEAEEAEEPEATVETEEDEGPETAEPAIDEDGAYYSKDEVALYLHTYGHLPDNFMTKKEAKKLGWQGGSLEKFSPGKVIGGDTFGNYEGILPDDKGQTYQECDIDTKGKKKRGAKRIVWGSDGAIYYTEDHYESFELLYPGE